MTSHTPEPIPNQPTYGSFGYMALYYQSQGLNIFPGIPDKKVPYGPKGNPQGYTLFKQAQGGERLTPEQINFFWERWPLANILMFPGVLSGVDVIDVDTKPGQESGWDTLEELGKTHLLSGGLVVNSPTGNGQHLYFLHSEDLRHRKLNHLGLEVFSGGTQWVVMPPSMFYNMDVIPHQHGQYTPIDFSLDGLKPVPQELVEFFNGLPDSSKRTKRKSTKNSPETPFSKMESTYPKTQVVITPRFTIKDQLANIRELNEKNSLKHLAKNSDFPNLVIQLKAKVANLYSQRNAPGILQMSLDKIKDEAHKALATLDKKRNWYLLDGGWIFKFKGYFHWVAVPGTQHDGVEVEPTPEELASARGKSTKHIRRNDGSIIVSFYKKNKSGKSSKHYWYYLLEGEYPELDEFI